jgi:hypothetical protein
MWLCANENDGVTDSKMKTAVTYRIVISGVWIDAPLDLVRGPGGFAFGSHLISALNIFYIHPAYVGALLVASYCVDT